jgi:hypothetical protein
VELISIGFRRPAMPAVDEKPSARGARFMFRLSICNAAGSPYDFARFPSMNRKG